MLGKGGLTMAEYIDREALMKKMLTKLRDWKQKQIDYESFVSGYAQGCIDVENAPTADVAEVRHGEWLEGNKRQPCSECLYRGVRAWSYCPNCGAKMDGKENDHE